jgi:elongation factor Ts
MGINATLVKTLREKTGAGVIACKNALAATDGDFDAAVERLREAELANAAKKANRVAAQGLVGVAVHGTTGAIVEVNTETDFVARTDAFRDAVSALARVALTIGKEREPFRRAADADLTDLLDAPAPDGGRVSDVISRLSARTGERVALRRSAAVSAARGIVSSYVHNAAAPGVGSIGVLVALESAADPSALAHIGHTLAMHVAAQAPLYVSREAIPSEVVAEKRAELAEQARHSGKPPSIVEKMIDGRMRKFYDEVALVQQPFVLNPDQDVAQAIQVAEQSVGAAIAVTAFVRFKIGERLEPEASR